MKTARLSAPQRAALALIAQEPRYTTTMTTRRPREWVLTNTASALVRMGFAEWRTANARRLVSITDAGRAALAAAGST